MTTQNTLTAAVSARSIIWVGDLTDQQKSDVLDSTLFCQLVAKKEVPNQGSQDDALNWYKVYSNTAGKIGWTLQKSEFTDLKFQKSSGPIEDTILAALGDNPEVGRPIFAAASRALLAYARAGEGSHADKVFNESSISESSTFASFQIMVASVDRGDVVLKCFAFFYSSSQEITKTLWFTQRDAIIDFKTSVISMVLNEGVYNQIRGTIKEKIGDKSEQFIIPLLSL